MKKGLKFLALSSALVLSVGLASCGEAETPTEATSEVDSKFEAYPESFSDWTISDMRTYLSAMGLINNTEYITMDLSKNELDAMHVTAGFLYVAMDGAVVDTFMFLDETNAESKTVLDGVYASKKIGEGDAAVTIDAAVGEFAFSYLLGSDDNHIDGLTAALDALVAYYKLANAFVNKA